MDLVFVKGSQNQDRQCMDVTIIDAPYNFATFDAINDLVEDRENFTVTLTTITSDSAVVLGNNETTVTITNDYIDRPTSKYFLIGSHIVFFF